MGDCNAPLMMCLLPFLSFFVSTFLFHYHRDSSRQRMEKEGSTSSRKRQRDYAARYLFSLCSALWSSSSCCKTDFCIRPERIRCHGLQKQESFHVLPILSASASCSRFQLLRAPLYRCVRWTPNLHRRFIGVVFETGHSRLDGIGIWEGWKLKR